MSGKLVIAIPSKGRLKEQSEEILAAAGFQVTSPFGERSYRGEIAGRPDIEVAFLSASEIARELARGAVHLGVTGEDLVKENIPQFDRLTCQIQPLGFGHADVVVAVPESWIDVASMEDLDDVAAGFRVRHGRRLRIATKYWNLTQRFFAGHGIAVYRIVDSLGATEGAPAAGLADAIVDITSTGSTLRANYLKTLDDGTILRSQANLFSSRQADWSHAASAAAKDLVAALAGSLRATSSDPNALRAASDAESRFSASLDGDQGIQR
ncbi:MAG: ATP phosphoribosyltransferase [Rhizobiales bacterium]|nr:ATP phosphoribosyltransferase [Hyphomicrobiales bacterium]